MPYTDTNEFTVALRSALNHANAVIVSMESYMIGEIHIPASYVSVTVTAYSYSEQTATWLAHNTTLTVAPSKVYPFPPEWSASKKLQLVSNADDSSRPVTIVTKGWAP